MVAPTEQELLVYRPICCLQADHDAPNDPFHTVLEQNTKEEAVIAYKTLTHKYVAQTGGI